MTSATARVPADLAARVCVLDGARPGSSTPLGEPVTPPLTTSAGAAA